MNRPAVLKLTATMPGTPEVDHPAPDRLLQGNPRCETWNQLDAALPPGRLWAGVWRCEPGRWRIAMGPHEHELFTVLSGRCRVHAGDGSVVEAGPGEAVILPAGFEGEFEALQTLTKTYAIVDASATPG
jgi:uncharacterized cupin superfamily protein